MAGGVGRAGIGAVGEDQRGEPDQRLDEVSPQ